MKKWTNKLLWIAAAVIAVIGVAFLIALRAVS